MGSTFSSIVRASAISGASTAVSMVVSVACTKVAALLLGTEGMGEMRLLISGLGLAGMLAGAGMATSGAQFIARAQGMGDQAQVAAAWVAMRRAALAFGLLTWFGFFLLSGAMSTYLFGDTSMSSSISVLGAGALFGAWANARNALLRGMGQIAALARVLVASSVLSGMASVACYLIWSHEGILAGLLASSAAAAIVASLPRSGLEAVLGASSSWRDSLRMFRSMFPLGAASMLGDFALAAATFLIAGAVSGHIGTSGNGLYSAAWSMASLLTNLIAGAMVVDLLPRMSRTVTDQTALSRLVNEQIEVAVLVTLPAVVVAVALAPLLLMLLYSSEFSEASSCMVLLATGGLIRIASLPLSYVFLATGASTLFLSSEIALNALHFGLASWLVAIRGLDGLGVAYLVTYLCFGLCMAWAVRRAKGVRLEPGTWILVICSVVAAGAAVLIRLALPPAAALPLGVGMSVIVVAGCLAVLVRRLGGTPALLGASRGLPLLGRIVRRLGG